MLLTVFKTSPTRMFLLENAFMFSMLNYIKVNPNVNNMQVSGQLEGVERMLESQLNINNQRMDNVGNKHFIDGLQGIESVFIAFLKSKFINIVYSP
jgi:hypothetical protein